MPASGKDLHHSLLNLVIRVPVRPRSRTRLPIEQEHRNSGVALLSSNKLMRTANKRLFGLYFKKSMRQSLASLPFP
jgi:hypothetical protein